MSSPYLLPPGNVQIAFSGGRTSGYMLHQILEANGGLREDVLVTFQNTGREAPQTLDYVQELGERWNVKIFWLEYRAGLLGGKATRRRQAGVFQKGTAAQNCDIS